MYVLPLTGPALRHAAFQRMANLAHAILRGDISEIKKLRYVDDADQKLVDDIAREQAIIDGVIEEAVAQLDSIADTFLNSGRKEEAIVTINQILLMNPPTANQYRQLLLQLQQH